MTLKARVAELEAELRAAFEQRDAAVAEAWRCQNLARQILDPPVPR
jgi:hypothetical protein